MSWADDLKDLAPGFKLHSFTTGKDGNVTSKRHVSAGRSDAEVAHIPDPAKVARTSTLYGPEGEVRAQWVIEKPEDEQRLQLWRAAAEEIASSAPPLRPIPAPAGCFLDSLMAGYPIGDHHMGMLAWKYETNASYDLDIGEKILQDAMRHLTACTPPTRKAIVAFLGDFMHYDSFTPATPANGNILDADGRAPKMVRASVRTMRATIDAALRRHEEVHVIVEIGNHDPFSAIFLQELLRVAYEAEPRVTVDTSPRHYHYYQFGKVLIGTHHGHGAKPDKLPGIMAADQAQMWGSTTHRYWWTGHIHTKTVSDFPGCTVESFRILPPPDAWAMNEGYRSTRGMHSIILHEKHGEVGRNTVHPAMLEDGNADGR